MLENQCQVKKIKQSLKNNTKLKHNVKLLKLVLSSKNNMY